MVLESETDISSTPEESALYECESDGSKLDISLGDSFLEDIDSIDSKNNAILSPQRDPNAEDRESEEIWLMDDLIDLLKNIEAETSPQKPNPSRSPNTQSSDSESQLCNRGFIFFSPHLERSIDIFRIEHLESEIENRKYFHRELSRPAIKYQNKILATDLRKQLRACSKKIFKLEEIRDYKEKRVEEIVYKKQILKFRKNFDMFGADDDVRSMLRKRDFGEFKYRLFKEGDVYCGDEDGDGNFIERMNSSVKKGLVVGGEGGEGGEMVLGG
jgi:hypothetical protein